MKWSTCLRSQGFCTAILGVTLGTPGARSDPLLPFDLPRWNTGERVRLEDFAGQILVLDFFAWWCGPCVQTSSELETGVQQFYDTRQGNSHGVPVRVVSVNIEKDFPRRTTEFLRRTGASFVVDDPSALLLKQYGNPGIPFLAVIDGTGSRPGAPRFEKVYQNAGFEGVAKLRQIIDGLGTRPADQSRLDRVKTGMVESHGLGAPRVQTLEADSEFTWASDILLTDSKVRYTHEKADTAWDASFGYASYDIDYLPFVGFDPFGFETHLREERFSAQAGLRQRVADPLKLLLNVGGYDGHSDYRRVWIANRYRQKYNHPKFPRVPPYEEPDPMGFNVSTGARWEYLPTTGFAELHVGYGKDQIAPGYEDSTDSQGNYKLLKGRERLNISTLTASSENVLTPRMRVLNEFSFSSTSGREVRFSYQGSLNLAMGERWVGRISGGVTRESPQFDAHFMGATLEWELVPKLLLSLTGRYYKDTGEIENALLLSNAAPPLESWEAGIGVRYSWARSSLKLYVAKFHTDHAPLRVGTAEFFHLYQDRNWGLAQIAYSMLVSGGRMTTVKFSPRRTRPSA